MLRIKQKKLFLHPILLISYLLIGSFLPLLANGSDAKWQSFDLDGKNSGVFEPSGVRQLDDGSIVLVQDESRDPLVLLRFQLNSDLDADMVLARENLIPATGTRKLPKQLNDLEGLASGQNGYLFAITSHSYSESGKRSKSRERLAQLRIENGEIRQFATFGKLRKAILQAYPELEAFVRSRIGKGRKGFSIEGLSSDRTGKKLLIGLRAPVLKGQSLILELQNPSALFSDENNVPIFKKEPIKLELDKGGIRAISYLPEIDRYLLVAQRERKKGTSKRSFKLWSWSGESNDTPQRLALDGIDLRHAEGITPVRINERDYIMFVSDDGNRDKKLSAHYLLMPLHTLGIPLKAE